MKKVFFGVLFVLALTGCREPQPEYQAVMNFIQAVSVKDAQAVDSMLWVNSAEKRNQILEAVRAGAVPAVLALTTRSTYGKAAGLGQGVVEVNFNLTFCTIKIESKRSAGLFSPKLYDTKICSFIDSQFKELK